MSKKNKDAVVSTDVPETVSGPKNWGYRLFAILLFAVCALAVVVLPYNALYASTTTEGVKNNSNSLMTILMDMFGAEGKLFGILPAFPISGKLGTFYTLAIYLFTLSIVIAVLLSIIAIFSAKKSPKLVRGALFFLACGAILYTGAYSITAETLLSNRILKVTAKPYGLPVIVDLTAMAMAIVFIFLRLLFSLKKVGKVAWVYGLQTFLSVVFAATIAMPMTRSKILVAENVNFLYKLVFIVAIVTILLNAFAAVRRISKDGCLVGQLVRYIFVTLVALAVIYVAHASKKTLGINIRLGVSKLVFPIVAAFIALVQMIIVIIQMRCAAKKAVEEAKVEATEEATSGFHMEAYAEAYAYEGGPVAGVLMAEEVNPSFLPQPPHVNTAGYDFYNCKSFDPFIATLNEQERNQFTELFILRFTCAMPEIPEYVVGGNNNEFFRKIFIYLGQYRDKIPSALLAKMYQFSIKI